MSLKTWLAKNMPGAAKKAASNTRTARDLWKESQLDLARSFIPNIVEHHGEDAARWYMQEVEGGRHHQDVLQELFKR